MPLYKMFADPFNTIGLVIASNMHTGFAFEVHDIEGWMWGSHHGPFEPHRLPLEAMEYTTLPQVSKKLEGRFVALEG
jgi:fructose 1,6-bisphosphatase